MALALLDGQTIAWPPRLVSGVDALRVKIAMIFRSFAAEWPADVRIGVPDSWFFGAMPSAAAVELYVRTQLLRIAEVQAVPTITATIGDGTISVSAVVLARTADGLVAITLGEPLPYDTRGAPAYYMTAGLLRMPLGPAWAGA
jgi:hypothetical protein